MSDAECWKDLIPNSPCDVSNLECWKTLMANKVEESGDKLQDKAK